MDALCSPKPPLTLEPNAALTFPQDVRKPGGGAWVAPADRRAMTAVEPFDVGLAALSKLHPVRYVLITILAQGWGHLKPDPGHV